MFISKSMRVFITIYQQRNLKKAADKLCLTVPPVSRMLKNTEDWLGEKLFVIERNNIIPTQAADELYRKISPHYAYLNEIQDVRKNHHLTISTPLSYAQFFSYVMDEVYKKNKVTPVLKYSEEIINDDDVFISFSRQLISDFFVEQSSVISYALCCQPDSREGWERKDLIVDRNILETESFHEVIYDLRNDNFTGDIIQVDNLELTKKRYESGGCLIFKPVFTLLNEEEKLPFYFKITLYCYYNRARKNEAIISVVESVFNVISRAKGKDKKDDWRGGNNDPFVFCVNHD